MNWPESQPSVENPNSGRKLRAPVAGLPDPYYNGNSCADPLAAVCVFHPDICHFIRGIVQVETEQKSNMGGTSFTPSAHGNVEISESVDRERFYDILSTALCGV